MFTQVNKTLDRSQGGLGIGLSFVKRLVEMHGGSVLAESPGAGQGSTFTIRLSRAATLALPVPADHPLVAATKRHEEVPGCRVLVVDDNADAADMLSMMLSFSGYQTCTVYSGAAALKSANSFQPEVVFLDLGMPGINGYKVAR